MHLLTVISVASLQNEKRLQLRERATSTTVPLMTSLHAPPQFNREGKIIYQSV